MNPETRIILPAVLEHLREAMDIVISFAEEQGFPPDRIMEIELSIEEALVNIINYAYPNGNGDMEISCNFSGQDQFVVEIVDQGIPFNMLSIRDPDVNCDVEDRKIGGMGIFFIRKLMDDVAYSRKDGRNVLRMTILRKRGEVSNE